MGQLSLRNVFVRGSTSSSRVISSPTADFTASVVSGVFPLTVTFTDTSTNTPTSWAWDFNNDGTVDSTSQNPTYTFSTAGTYAVKLTATNASGSGEVVKTSYITVLSPVYTLSRSAVEVNEGASITITLSTQYVSTGTVVPYTISGTGVTSGDIGGVSLTGAFVVAGTYNSGTSSVTLNITADTLTEGAETITLSIEAQAQTISVVVNDTSITPVVIDSYSVYFDGTGDYLQIAATTNLQLTTGNFTVEAWIYPLSFNGPQYSCPIFSYGDDSLLLRCMPLAATSTNLNMYAVNAAGSVILGTSGTSGGNVYLNQWTHVAVTRSGSTFTLWVNGASVATATSADTLKTNSIVWIGRSSAGSNPWWNGYISNLRVIKGTAVYTSNFTPSTAPLTAISGTSLLTCQNDTVVDNSTNNFTITVNGDAIRSNYSPFESNGNYWSGYFDGTGDYLDVTDSALFDLSTSDFTIEFWINPTAVNANGMIILDTRTSASNGYVIHTTSTNNSILFSNAGSTVVTSASGVGTGNWAHVCVVKYLTSITIYINGVSRGSVSYSTGVNASGLRIASKLWSSSGVAAFNGYISNLRIVKGTALYTSSFTPPTAPLTAVTGTSLLTLQNMNLVDNSTNNFTITRVGDTTLQPTGPVVYDSGYYSNYFDGSGDYLSLPTNAAALGNIFTIEMWVYPIVTPSSQYYYIGGGAGQQGPLIGYNGATFAIARQGAWVLTSPTNPTVGVWNHIALVREGTGTNQYKLYLNGVLMVTGTETITFAAQTNTTIGGPNAYISNFRIVNGTALYTSNFTPSTTPLTAISGTSLLTCQSQGFRDNSTNNFAITAVGNTAVKAINPFNSNFSSSPLTWSTYFDGTDDYLTVPSNAGFNFGSGNFTVEYWMNPASIPDLAFGVIGCWAPGWLIYQTATVYTFYIGNSTVVMNISHNIKFNDWTHYAVTRSGNDWKLFVNGIQVGSTVNNTSTIPDSTVPLAIGINYSGLRNDFKGYLSNVRIVKGTAVYTSNFTPSTTPLTAIAGTKLLTCQTAFNESNAIEHVATITANGNAVTRPVTPFLS